MSVSTWWYWPSQRRHQHQVNDLSRPFALKRYVPTLWTAGEALGKLWSGLRLRLPLSPRGPVAAISIEGITLRILKAQRNQVLDWASIPFNVRFMRGGFIQDPVGMGQVIKSALESRGLAKAQVVCALPGQQAVSRIMPLPPVSKAELPSVVNREARRLLSFSPDSSYLFWQSLEPVDGRQRAYVLIVPKAPLNNLLEALKAAGITHPRAIDLKPLALARSVNLKDAIVVNSESNHIEVVIVLNDVPVLTRSIPLGDSPQATATVAGRLLDELGRSVAFYNETYRDNPLDTKIPIVLTGDLIAQMGIEEEAATATGRTVVPFAPPLNYATGFPVASFAVNVGLILKLL